MNLFPNRRHLWRRRRRGSNLLKAESLRSCSTISNSCKQKLTDGKPNERLSIINIKYPYNVKSCLCIKNYYPASLIEMHFVSLKDLLNCQ